MKIYNTEEVANILDCTTRTITSYCRDNRVNKIKGIYQITENDITLFKKRLHQVNQVTGLGRGLSKLLYENDWQFEEVEKYRYALSYQLSKVNMLQKDLDKLIEENKVLVNKYNNLQSDLYELKDSQIKEYTYTTNTSRKTKTYLLKDKNTGLYKIGKSVNPLNREKTLQGEKPTYELLKVWDDNIERELHDKYKNQRVRGEWFELNSIQVRYICTHY